jgi:hypothetical protein
VKAIMRLPVHLSDENVWGISLVDQVIAQYEVCRALARLVVGVSVNLISRLAVYRSALGARVEVGGLATHSTALKLALAITPSTGDYPWDVKRSLVTVGLRCVLVSRHVARGTVASVPSKYHRLPLSSSIGITSLLSIVRHLVVVGVNLRNLGLGPPYTLSSSCLKSACSGVKVVARVSNAPLVVRSNHSASCVLLVSAYTSARALVVAQISVLCSTPLLTDRIQLSNLSSSLLCLTEWPPGVEDIKTYWVVTSCLKSLLDALTKGRAVSYDERSCYECCDSLHCLFSILFKLVLFN